MNALELKVPPPIVALVCGLIVWVLAKHLPIVEFDFAHRWIVGIAVSCIGISFDIFGMAQFVRQKTTITPMNPSKSSSLVSSGIYGWTRNPMYLGMAIILFGWVVYCGAISGLFGIAIFVAYITRFQIKPEERMLRALFPGQYDDYCARVRRWI